MRRKLALLMTAISLSVLGGVTVAATASAAPSPRSVHNWCPNDSDSAHPGKHLGWFKSGNTERRNLGGTCPAG